MSVRHIRAHRGEHVVVHRDKEPGCLEYIGALIVIIVIIKLLASC